MEEQLLLRSVSERMFAQQAAIVERLITNPLTPVRIIERHFFDLNTRWIMLQEKHESLNLYLIQSKSLQIMHLSKNIHLSIFV